MAPELLKNGRASTQTDMFGYGVLVLEVICGRQPIEEGMPPLVDWVWELMKRGKLVNAMDERLRARGGFDEGEVEKVLHLGLLCAHPDPNVRPTMRQVVKFFEGKNEADESDGEDMDAYLLQRMESSDIWPNYSLNIGSHPTFEEIRERLSSSMSLSWSNSMDDSIFVHRIYPKKIPGPGLLENGYAEDEANEVGKSAESYV
ncbi:hypothetical protein ACH5RR_017915 [Cinchona calisaya]|uniref:Protein kinase domain-containing protein n=1 Tax=Cinchona calisaya TaxID=153742 RepID=A0ABD2ZK27_9GENT